MYGAFSGRLIRRSDSMARCGVTSGYTPWTFTGEDFPDPTLGNDPPLNGDYYWTDLYAFTTSASVATPGQIASGYAKLTNPSTSPPVNVAPGSLLPWLWAQAAGEWP